ncbi:hypothetical protein Gotri_006153, partial [Gossypium trilobum]|nr:hypothetical protein [Gossypium trilobum]
LVLWRVASGENFEFSKDRSTKKVRFKDSNTNGDIDMLMDIENGYFLAKFQNKNDYKKVLSQRPWIIYGQYLTVQPWTMDFNPMQLYPSIILEEIEGIIGKFAKKDFNIDSGTIGKFARMVVYVNLDKPLVSQ